MYEVLSPPFSDVNTENRAILSNLMPTVVKIVGSTPTARTINESEVVGVLDTEQNKYMRQGVGCKL